MRNIQKILTIMILMMSLNSCVYKDRNVNFSGNDYISPDFDYKKLQLTVIDGRNNPEKIGKKNFGEKVVRIYNRQHLKSLIRDRVARILFVENLKIKKPLFLEIYLIKFKYNTKSGIKGVANGESIIKVVVRSEARKVLFRKSYKFAIEKEYLISPTARNDRKNVNLILNESINKVFLDSELMTLLKSGQK